MSTAKRLVRLLGECLALCALSKVVIPQVPESSFWTAAVDGLLLRATAISMEVHEEVWCPSPASAPHAPCHS